VPPAIFSGVGVALVTLFDDRGEVDAKATAGLAVRLVDQGMRAIVVAGSTGEASSLDPGERLALSRPPSARAPRCWPGPAPRRPGRPSP